MKVAISATDGKIDTPGDGKEILIYEIEGDNVKLVERYGNPALNAGPTRGIYMLKSALEKGADAIILKKIAPPGFNFIKGKAKLFLVDGLVEEALEKLKRGELNEAEKPNFEGTHSV